MLRYLPVTILCTLLKIKVLLPTFGNCCSLRNRGEITIISKIFRKLFGSSKKTKRKKNSDNPKQQSIEVLYQ